MPKIIYFKLRNMTLSQLHDYFDTNWDKLTNYISKYFLVIAYQDKIHVMFKIEL